MISYEKVIYSYVGDVKSFNVELPVVRKYAGEMKLLWVLFQEKIKLLPWKCRSHSLPDLRLFGFVFGEDLNQGGLHCKKCEE
jgi:hypothetical protein